MANRPVTKKIRLLTTVSFLDGAHEGGSLVEVEEHQAASLIANGSAEDAEANGAPESAMQGPAAEQAMLPEAESRG